MGGALCAILELPCLPCTLGVVLPPLWFGLSRVLWVLCVPSPSEPANGLLGMFRKKRRRSSRKVTPLSSKGSPGYPTRVTRRAMIAQLVCSPALASSSTFLLAPTHRRCRHRLPSHLAARPPGCDVWFTARPHRFHRSPCLHSPSSPWRLCLRWWHAS